MGMKCLSSTQEWVYSTLRILSSKLTALGPQVRFYKTKDHLFQRRVQWPFKCLACRAVLFPDLRLQLFSTWIHPVLEFGCKVWNLSKLGLDRQIEFVQRQVTRTL
ncbi:hypothetical protein Ciccas_000479 [Cichlidogyrus casuarinus]|uniref:Uncharacterized protein n=1 Tax=Cichlidogyrus casuarinus TaxID=1844966 RepID=A0ABD2QMU6_9PLAT